MSAEAHRSWYRVRVGVFLSIEGEGSERRHAAACLFDPSLTATGVTVEEARRRLATTLRPLLRDPVHVRRLCLWGEPEEDTAELKLMAGRLHAPVPTPVVWIDHGGDGVTAVLPRAGATFLFVEAPLGARGELLEQAVSGWRNRVRQDLSGLTLDRQPGDRVEDLTVETDHPWRGPLPGSLWERLGLGRDAGLDGREELAAVADDLRGRGAAELRPELVEVPLAGELRQRLFEARRPTPVALIGPAGSGRTTVVHAALTRQRRLEETAPPAPQRHVWHLDPARVIAGQSLVGQWQRRFQAILDTIASPPGRTGHPDVLFIDQVLPLTTVGRYSGGSLTLSAMLRGWLADRPAPCVVEATPEQWQRLEEADPGLAALFEVVRVDPPDEDTELRMLLRHASERRVHLRVQLGTDVLRRLVDVHRTHPSARGAPAGLIERLDALVVGRKPGWTSSAADVDAMIGATTGLRAELVDPGRAVRDEDEVQRFTARLIGQPDAVQALVSVVHLLKSGLARRGRPVASMLLVGPTGVGKTEAARLLADRLFADRGRLLRLDMNEYIDGGAPHRLLGGNGHEGLLTGPVRFRPEVVLLLDEIEKAHPRVHDLLLQLLDEGRLTDGHGRLVRFDRAVVVLTSNVGADEARRALGFDRDGAGSVALFRAAVERAFRPELVNRLDRVVVFRPLAAEHVRRIAGLVVAQVMGREGFLRRTVFLDLQPEVLDRLATAGLDPAMGARALKRVVEQTLVAPVAAVFAGVPPDRPAVVEVRDVGGELRADARALIFAEPLQRVRALEVPALDELVALEALLDQPMVARAGPEGTHLEGVDRAQVRARLREVIERLTPDEPALAVPSALDIQRLRRRMNRADAWGVPSAIDWTGAAPYRTVAAWLLDSLTPTVQPAAEAVELAVVAHQAMAALDGRPDACRLTVRLLAGALPTETAGWDGISRWIGGIVRAVEQLGGHATVWHHTRKGTWRESTSNGSSRWIVHCTGPGVADLIAAEAGIHVMWGLADSADEGARLYAAEVLPDGPPEVHDPDPGRPVVRIAVHDGEGLRLHDHRLGENARLAAGDPMPLAWWLRVTGGVG